MEADFNIYQAHARAARIEEAQVLVKKRAEGSMEAFIAGSRGGIYAQSRG